MYFHRMSQAPRGARGGCPVLPLPHLCRHHDPSASDLMPDLITSVLVPLRVPVDAPRPSIEYCRGIDNESRISAGQFTTNLSGVSIPNRQLHGLAFRVSIRSFWKLFTAHRKIRMLSIAVQILKSFIFFPAPCVSSTGLTALLP